jgi:hypothetical protein
MSKQGLFGFDFTSMALIFLRAVSPFGVPYDDSTPNQGVSRELQSG